MAPGGYHVSSSSMKNRKYRIAISPGAINRAPTCKGTGVQNIKSPGKKKLAIVLLSGGLPAVQALEVVQRTSPSERMKASLITITDQVRAGSSLHLALEQAKVLDPLAVEMVRVGEQSSALPEMLNHVADFFDQEVEKATTAVTSLIGPVMILFMGVVVLALLLAIYVPLFNASSVVH